MLIGSQASTGMWNVAFSRGNQRLLNGIDGFTADEDVWRKLHDLARIAAIDITVGVVESYNRLSLASDFEDPDSTPMSSFRNCPKVGITFQWKKLQMLILHFALLSKMLYPH